MKTKGNEGICKGKDVNHIFDCQGGFVGRLDDPIASYATTVYERDICVVESAHSVCDQVSEIGFLASDRGRPAVKGNANMEEGVLDGLRDAVVYGGKCCGHGRGFGERLVS